MTLNRWPSSKPKRAPQKVHPLPQRLQNSRVFTPPPVKLLRGVHPPVAQLRAIDMAPVLLRAERDAPKQQRIYSGFDPGFKGHSALIEGVIVDGEIRVTKVTEIPFAPVAAPQPAGAPVDPYVAAGHPWARVGMLVRSDLGIETIEAPPPGKLKTVSLCSHVWTRFGSEEYVGWWDDGDVKPVEPLPSETPESGDWTPPAPWKETTPRAEGQARRWTTSAGDVVAIMRDGRFAHYADAKPYFHVSLESACDAALSHLAAHARLVSR